jgi:hypothetical protein
MQLTGVIVVAFFTLQLFRTIGFGCDGALISAVLLGFVNLSSIIVSTFTVDRYGWKVFVHGWQNPDDPLSGTNFLF